MKEVPNNSISSKHTSFYDRFYAGAKNVLQKVVKKEHSNSNKSVKYASFYDSLKKEHKEVYDALNSTVDRIPFAIKNMQEELLQQKTEESKQELEQALQKWQYALKVYTFMLDNREKIFGHIDQKEVAQLSEEQFHGFLFLMSEGIAKLGANEKNYSEICSLVNNCLESAREKEAWEAVKNAAKSVITNIVPSPVKKLLGKIPYVREFVDDDKEKEKISKSDKQVVARLVRSTSISGIFAAMTILSAPTLFGIPAFIIVGATAFGFTVNSFRKIKGELFNYGNDKTGTIYDIPELGPVLTFSASSLPSKSEIEEAVKTAAKHLEAKEQAGDRQKTEELLKNFAGKTSQSEAFVKNKEPVDSTPTQQTNPVVENDKPVDSTPIQQTDSVKDSNFWRNKQSTELNNTTTSKGRA